MTIKLFGAIFVITGCGGLGFSMAAAYRAEEQMLRQLTAVLQFMQCELRYRLTDLAALCRMAGAQGKGTVYKTLTRLGEELESCRSSEVYECVCAAMAESSLSPVLRTLIQELGTSLGRFDLEGQLQGLEHVRQRCAQELAGLQEHRTDRLRTYQTLGLCAGAALVILLV